MKAGRKRKIALLVLLVLLSLAGQVEASDGMRGDRCVVGQDEYIVEDFYFFCRLLDVYGTVDGDLIGLAAEVTLHRGSKVSGDLWVGGGRLLVEGTVGDDMHFAGLTVIVTDTARFTDSRIDLVAAALNVELRADAVLPGDLLVYGYQARVAGTVGGDIDFGGEALIIEGVIVGRVDAEVGDARRGWWSEPFEVRTTLAGFAGIGCRTIAQVRSLYSIFAAMLKIIFEAVARF